MWYINYPNLIASLRQENPGETIVPMLASPGGDGGVSDPACPGTTMVSRRWVTSSSSPAFADHASNTGELQLLWPARCTSTANCQHWPPHPNWGGAHLHNSHHFSFLLSFLAERSWSFWSPLSCGHSKDQNLPSTCRSCPSRMKIALLLFFISMSWSQDKNIFVFANFFLASTTHCISWVCYEYTHCAAE